MQICKSKSLANNKKTDDHCVCHLSDELNKHKSAMEINNIINISQQDSKTLLSKSKTVILCRPQFTTYNRWKQYYWSCYPIPRHIAEQHRIGRWRLISCHVNFLSKCNYIYYRKLQLHSWWSPSVFCPPHWQSSNPNTGTSLMLHSWVTLMKGGEIPRSPPSMSLLSVDISVCRWCLKPVKPYQFECSTLVSV